MQKYKAIGFDYMGVVYGKPGSSFMKELAVSLGIAQGKLNEAYFHHNHHFNVKGEAMEKVWKETLIELHMPERLSDVLTFQEKREEEKEVNSEIVKLIEELKLKSYKIGLLSNWSTALRSKLEDLKIWHLFDAVTVSAEIGFMKPEPEAFQKFSEMLGVKPNELIYIDDTTKSLETAPEVGYTPILYETFEGLEEKLRSLGIL